MRDVIVTTEDDDNNGWDLALPPAAGATATDAAMKPSTGQEPAVMRDALLNNSNRIISLKGMY